MPNTLPQLILELQLNLLPLFQTLDPLISGFTLRNAGPLPAGLMTLMIAVNHPLMNLMDKPSISPTDLDLSKEQYLRIPLASVDSMIPPSNSEKSPPLKVFLSLQEK